ncbi:MAG: universal stress protein, partial [Natrialbaceae archaeon]
VGLDLVRRFDGAVHALSVVDESEVASVPADVRDELHQSLERQGRRAVERIAEEAEVDVTTAIREGRPATEICAYAEEVDADAIALGTRGRHGEHAFLLGSVAESVVRQAPQPVLTVRQLDSSE